MNLVDIHKVNDLDNIKPALIQIASALNRNNINWGLGGSLLLYLYGMNTTVGDIDIVIDEKDINKVEKVVSTFVHIEKPKSGVYLTEKFYSITINNVGIDLMMGFKIKTQCGVYSFPKDNTLAEKNVMIEDTKINISSLDDWLEAYEAMNRVEKIALIKQFKQIAEEK